MTPNPRLQRTPSATPPSPLSRQPLGARSRLVVLVALAAATVLRADGNKGKCGRFPDPGFDGPGMSSFTGAYTNPNYGFSVVIPMGLTGHDVPPPSPHHGFGIVLSWEPRAYVNVDGTYNYLDDPEAQFDINDPDQALPELAKLHSRWIRNSSRAVISTTRTATRLGELHAVRQVSRYTCSSVAGVYITDSVFAMSGNVVYSLELLTTKSRYPADRVIFDQLVSSWHLANQAEPAPNARLQRTPSASPPSPLSRQPLDR